MRVEDLISALEVERAKVAHSALTQAKPGEFEYGRAVGFYAGLTRAKALLDGLIDDEREKRL